MPVLKLIKTNFNGGEIGNNSLGRVDQDHYGTSCETLENFMPRIQGGITRRPGTRFIAPAMGLSRLIPFVFSLEASFMLEFGSSGKIHFYTRQGQIQSTGPSWNGSLGGTTTDNTAIWTNIGNASQGGTSTVYPIGAYILDGNGNLQRCVISGKIPVSNPVWNPSVGKLTTFSVSFGTISSQWINMGQPSFWQGNVIRTTSDAPILDTNGNLEQVTTGGQSGSATVYEVSTPFTSDDDLWLIKYVQVGNIMYLVHPSYPPMKLTRVSDTNWVFNAPGFYAPPTNAFDQDVTEGTITVTLGVVGPAGTSTSATASSPVFITGDIGKAVVGQNGVGVGYITALSGSTSTDPDTSATRHSIATILIITPFLSTSLGITWKLRGSPNAFLAFGTIASGPLWLYTRKRGAGAQIDGYAYLSYPVEGLPPPPNPADVFRQIDIGSYILAAGSVLQLNSLTNATHATFTQITAFTVLVGVSVGPTGGQSTAQVPDAASGGEWTIETPSFSSVHGYPAAVAFAQDRLYFASTDDQPQTVWGSEIDNLEQFGKGQQDSDAMAFTVASGRFEKIQWMQSFQGSIVCGTFAGEYLINGGGGAVVSGTSAPITPSNVNVLLQSTYGSSGTQPVTTQNDLIYVQRAKKTLYQFTFNIYQSSYASKNLNLWNEDITVQSVKEMCYAESPFYSVFLTDLAGNFFGLVYEKMNEVWGWYRMPTGVNEGDTVVSVSTIPSNTNSSISDEIWLVTQRSAAIDITTGGRIPIFCIEIMDPSINLDCASHTVFNAPVTQIGGMDYLFNRNIQVVVDNQVLPQVLMDNTGIYHFPSGVSGLDVQAGIGYDSKFVMLRPEYSAGGQTIQGQLKGWNKIFVRVLNTLGLTINQKPVAFRRAGDQPVSEEGFPDLDAPVLGQAVTWYTGDVKVLKLGADRDGKISLEQMQPLPATILALYGELEFGNVP